MKKVISVILAFTLLLAMSVPVDTVSINPKSVKYASGKKVDKELLEETTIDVDMVEKIQ